VARALAAAQAVDPEFALFLFAARDILVSEMSEQAIAALFMEASPTSICSPIGVASSSSPP